MVYSIEAIKKAIAKSTHGEFVVPVIKCVYQILNDTRVHNKQILIDNLPLYKEVIRYFNTVGNSAKFNTGEFHLVLLDCKRLIKQYVNIGLDLSEMLEPYNGMIYDVGVHTSLTQPTNTYTNYTYLQTTHNPHIPKQTTNTYLHKPQHIPPQTHLPTYTH